MDNVTLRSAVEVTEVPGGATFAVSAADPEVVGSIVRMVTAHATTMDDPAGWRYHVTTSDIGAVMTVIGDAAQIRALGFIGVMTVGMHHQAHHWAIAAGAAPSWVKKAISAEWTWFEDYVFLWATYTLACSPGCSCQAGMGLMAFGEPRGEKIRFNGSREVLVIGAGAIPIRVVDGGSGCSAALAPGKFGLVPLVDLSW